MNRLRHLTEHCEQFVEAYCRLVYRTLAARETKEFGSGRSGQ